MAQGMEPRGEAPVFSQMENSLREVTSEVEVHKRAQRATQKPFVTLPVGAGEGTLLPGVLWEQRDGAGGALRGWIRPRGGERRRPAARESKENGEKGRRAAACVCVTVKRNRIHGNFLPDA